MENPAQWDNYQALVEAASTHIKSIQPGIKIGVQGMFEGFFDQEMKTLNSALDIVALSYYPVVEKPGHMDIGDIAAIKEDLAQLVAFSEGKKIYIPELGYSSSEVLDSSEEEQRDFVREFFRVWDLYSDNLQFVELSPLHDPDPEWMAELLAVLGMDEHPLYDEILAAYVSGGLRTYDGEDKLAFPAFREEARTRGWE
jgi:hypothetical protein